MMNKILFLDFDGVLHPSMCPSEKQLSQAPLLAGLMTEFPCRIVISSSWRFQYTLEQLKKILPKAISNQVIGMTGDACEGAYQRYQEIKRYLEVHDKSLSDWKALDDSHNEFPKDCGNLIICSHITGLGQKQIMEVKKWLQN
jgi:hypothetical protein